MKHIAWCVTVGKGNIAYIMDNKTFDKKRDAVGYRNAKGYKGFSWTTQWYISKLQVME